MDLFVSYAWTSDAHRQWVQLLASSMHLLGYDVRIDQDVDYGNSLSGFMRALADAKHVLLVVDSNYVVRADGVPSSGVAIENERVQDVFPDRPANWLSVVFVDNPGYQLPAWLRAHRPRSFDFNANPAKRDFPGKEQLDDLWRWLEGLPPSKTNAIPLAAQVERAARLERMANLRDPGLSRCPALAGEVLFEFGHSASATFTVGHGDYEFPIRVSSHGFNSVYIYSDALDSVGLVRDLDDAAADLTKLLTPGRTVNPSVGQGAVLMNKQGMLCTVRILNVQREINERNDYVAPHVRFEYEILLDRTRRCQRCGRWSS